MTTVTADEIARVAARLIAESASRDYTQAWLRAAETLGTDARLDEHVNGRVHEALMAHQALFGGEDYRRRLQRLRACAEQAMRLLTDFRPRAVGSVVDGALNAEDEVHLHVFAEPPEAVDLLLQERGIDFRPDERRMRTGRGQWQSFPSVRFVAGGITVDAVIFPERPGPAPLSRLDGRPIRRLDLAALQGLIAAAGDETTQA